MPPVPRLALTDITVRYGRAVAVSALSLDVAPGEVVCLLGPSGCGKSSTLRVAAGVERQASGRVAIDGAVVSEGALHLPPERRSIGLMFQDFALFPHLTVAENVAFGLERAGLRALRRASRSSVAAAVRDLLVRVDLAGFGEKYPHQLSGGEQQRVALARALAPRPAVMLMDEPFSGLDNRLRDGVRDETLRVLKGEGAGVLLVTHEPDEAMRMADRIALMRQGRIVQTGAPYNVYNHPVDRQAAAFFSDLNVIEGVVTARQTDTPFGLFLAPGLADGARVEIVVRPQHLKVAPALGTKPRPTAADGVAAAARVVRARFMGAETLVEAAMEQGGQVLRATLPYAWLPEPGTPLWISLRRDRCLVFPAPAGAAALAQAAE